ncbi:MAG: ABC transporter permease [Gammaproteobacteria bacterium]|nr:ABC transporter permease [Gammaproteobacteria bacterium]
MIVAHIARRELRSLFASPFGWSVLAVIGAALGVLFFYQLRYFLEPPPEAVLMPELWGVTRIAIAPMLNWAAFLLALVIPLLTMRQLADERRLRTLALHLSAPIGPAQFVFGKLLGTMVFVAICITLTLLPVLALTPTMRLDYGVIASALLALALLSTSISAFGLFMSSLTDNSALAGTVTLALVIVSWVLGAHTPGDIPAPAQTAMQYLSWQHHLEPGLRGLVTAPPLAFHGSIIALSLYFTIRRLRDASRMMG